jgi:adenylate cyclase
MGARYFLTGRLAQLGERVRIIIHFLETATNAQLWGDSYDGEASNLFGLQDRVTEEVVRAILPAVRGAEMQRAQHKRPEDLDAYDLSLRALPFVFASNPNASRQALDLLHRALEIDPDYALSTALAAWCHAQLAVHHGTRSPGDEKQRALLLAERAAILDPNDSQVLTARSAVHTIAGQFDVAGSLISRALALDPSSAWAWERSAWLKTFAGEPEAGLAHMSQAIRLDPSSPSHANRLVGLGSAHFDAGRYEQAAFWMRQALRERPSTAWVNRTLSVSYARLGERLAALDSLDALKRYCPDVTIGQIMASLPFPQDFMGRVAEGLDDLGLPP